MTREEEINNAKEAFYRKILQEGTYYDPRDCFEEGAEWADTNPKSPWISVNDDLPYNHEELLNAKYQTKEVSMCKGPENCNGESFKNKRCNAWNYMCSLWICIIRICATNM